MEPNAPAYPQHGYSENPEVVARMSQCSGITIRAEFAKAAMQGIIANPREWLVDGKRISNVDDAAVLAVEAADALIAELNKTKA